VQLTSVVDGRDRSLDPVVEVVAGTVALGGRHVLREVALRVSAGEVTALLGPNGSGKSTLVRAVVGLVPLAGGSVQLFGTPLNRFRAWNRIGYVPQRTTAASGVPATAREVVTSGMLAGQPVWRPLSRADRVAVDDALATVGLGDRAGEPVASLSGGQQQRVLIARALARRAQLLIMDEPMAGVDLASQSVLAATLDTLLAHGTTVLLVAHELGSLERHVRHTVVLRGGKVVYDGAPRPAAGHHALPGHDHLHPHEAGDTRTHPWQVGLHTGGPG